MSNRSLLCPFVVEKRKTGEHLAAKVVSVVRLGAPNLEKRTNENLLNFTKPYELARASVLKLENGSNLLDKPKEVTAADTMSLILASKYRSERG